MGTIRVLDVTLRDGGIVIDFNFGQAYMDQILSGLNDSGAEIIELGYLDQKKGTEYDRTQFSSVSAIRKNFIKKKSGVSYVAMFDFGKFDPDKLEPRQSTGIDGIRLAFHKRDWKSALIAARFVLRKGYQLYLQPMVIMRYSAVELLELIKAVNTDLPDLSAFYIVDSFGEMRLKELHRIARFIDEHLLPTMPVGFHSHNNLQLSYSNAVDLLQYLSNRDLIIDSAILGMGKGAGNMNTELFMEHLNLYYGKEYKIAPLLEVIDKVLNTIRAESYWGYSIEYYLSSINHCTPSYAGHFYKKHMLPVARVAELLSLIPEDKKLSFDREYAEALYLTYNASRHRDDDSVIEELTKKIKGKKVLLIAPGKSIIEERTKIENLLDKPEVISISLNNSSVFQTDYVFVTRDDELVKAHDKGDRVITTTALVENIDQGFYVIDYQKWVSIEGETQDSSGVLALKLFTACGAEEILLAGFDGFSTNMNLNYYDKTMRRPVSEEQAEKRNAYFHDLVSRLRNRVKISFVTRSLYE